MGEDEEKLSPGKRPAPAATACDEGPGAASASATLETPSVALEERKSTDKIIEEAAATTEEQEEKLAEAVENAEKAIVEDRELIPSIDEEPAPASFVEESYYVRDLKESEKKALQDLKGRIADAIKSNTFLAPSLKAAPPVSATRDIDVDKAEGKEKKDDLEEGTKKEEKPVEKAEASSFVPSEVPAFGIDAPLTSVEPLPELTPVVAESEATTVNEASATTSVVPEVAPIVKEVSAQEEKVVEVEPPSSVHDRSAGGVAIGDDSPLEDLRLWGVPLLHTRGDERTDVVLLKFLRARDFKVNDAMSMLKDTMIWRKEFGADNLVNEEIATEFDSVAYMHGVDKEGHPVCYNHYGIFQDKELYQKTLGDEARFKKFLRWRIQVLEKGMQTLDFNPSGVHSMVQVIDLKDSPGFVKCRNITKKAFALLQDNYPELVAKQIFVNVPWYFGALYTLYGKFMTARSKSKVVAARSEKVTETLFKYISPENLPVCYGGFSRPNDMDFEDAKVLVTEVTVKAGEKQTIELPEQEVGSTVVWDVAVVGWDVVYGEEFVPSGEGRYTVVVQKPKRVTAAEVALRNSFKAVTEAGKVVITIDNTSRRKKLAVYRHTTKKNNSSES